MAASATPVIILVLNLVVIVILVVLCIKAAIDVKDAPGYNQSPLLISAHKYLSWTGAIGCILAAIMIIGLIYLFFRSAQGISNGVVITLLVITGAIALTMGIFCVLAAQDLHKYTPQSDIGPAYRLSYIAAILGVAIVSITIIGGLIYALNSGKKKSVAKEQQMDVAAAKVKLRQKEILADLKERGVISSDQTSK